MQNCDRSEGGGERGKRKGSNAAQTKRALAAISYGWGSGTGCSGRTQGTSPEDMGTRSMWAALPPPHKTIPNPRSPHA
eukprot:5405660-Pyramimonas_sp.AAC.1